MRHAALTLAILATPAFAVDPEPARAPEPAAAGLEAARASLDAGDHAGALALLRPVAAAEPANADALNLMGFASRRMGALEDAMGFYEAALAADPRHLGALEYQGELFVMQGETAMAEANLQRLAEICGTCPEHAALAAAIADGEGW